MQEELKMLQNLINLMSDKQKNMECVLENLLTENEELKKRVDKLEAKKNSKKDHRINEELQHVLGFTLSNVRGYYNAVKTVDGVQLRVYVGKDIDLAKKKIVEHFTTNFRFHKSEIKLIPELLEVPEIRELLDKENT